MVEMRVEKSQDGSALLLAVFVLVLIASMGVGLLFTTQTELLMSTASVHSKQTFYLSEGGLEDGRDTIFQINKISAKPRDLTEELQALSGGDNTLDFDYRTVQPTYDVNGNLTGFTGYGNDVPLKSLTGLGNGWYAAFLNNDPVEGVTNVNDANNRLLLTAIAVDENGGAEMVRALIERPDTFAIPPAAITILGPNAIFDGGPSSAKNYTGDDHGSHCPPGVGGDVPVVGVIGGTSESSAEAGVQKPASYTQGAESGVDTVDDLTLIPNLPDLWTDCELLVELGELIWSQADLRGDSSTPAADLGTPGAGKSVFITGDYVLSGGFTGKGLLWVTGELTMDGNASWEGPIFVVGEGDFLRDGAGNGSIGGGVIVADVSGADRVLFTGDDCGGDDGTLGTSDDGIAQSSYLVNGSGTGTTGYCSAYFTDWQSMRPFKILSFVQE
jgi:hypothetical protein